MDLTVELGAWCKRLKEQGHAVLPIGGRKVAKCIVSFPADISIILGSEADDVVAEPFRKHFFFCQTKPEIAFGIIQRPELHHARWLELVFRQPPSYWKDFLAGPGSWTLARLSRFKKVIYWAEGGYAWELIDNSTHRQWGVQIPTEAASFFPTGSGRSRFCARVIDVAQQGFPDVVAACFLLANVGGRNCYLADEAAKEVYLAQNDEMVFVSIPELGRRLEFLQELERAGATKP